MKDLLSMAALLVLALVEVAMLVFIIRIITNL